MDVSTWLKETFVIVSCIPGHSIFSGAASGLSMLYIEMIPDDTANAFFSLCMDRLVKALVPFRKVSTSV